MPEIDTRSTQESNFQIEKTSNNTFVVRSDSERFGKQEITYESPNREDCLEYIAQRRPERQIRFYIIPDLMSWSMPAYFDEQTPIEKYDSLQEAVARFQELYPQSYNAEVTDRNSVGLTYARLTLGMEWSEKGKLPGAIDLIHVRKGQADHATHDNDVMKDLCDDFTRVESFNTDRRLLAMLRQLEHEIGFDRVVLYDQNSARTMPYTLWENEFFEPIGYTEAILESQFAYVIVGLQPNYAVDYAIYDNVTAELMGTGRLPRTDYLSFEEAARAALNEPGAALKRHDLSVRDSLLEAVEEFPKKRMEPVMLKTWWEAAEHKEHDAYNRSQALNVEFMDEMTSRIRSTYDGRSLDGTLARRLLAEFGTERTSALLANVIQHRPWDGRFSPDNRRWAQSFDLPHDDVWDKLSRCDTHPGLLNVLTTEVRREIRAQEQTQSQPTRLADRLEAARDSVQRQSPAQEQNNQHSRSGLEL